MPILGYFGWNTLPVIGNSPLIFPVLGGILPLRYCLFMATAYPASAAKLVWIQAVQLSLGVPVGWHSSDSDTGGRTDRGSRHSPKPSIPRTDRANEPDQCCNHPSTLAIQAH